MPTEKTRALEPKSMKPWHKAVIDIMLANPNMKQGEIAAQLGRTQHWLSIVVNSDAFQNELAERRNEVVDPLIIASTEQRFKSVVSRALDKMAERLEQNAPISNRDLISTIDVAAKGLGLGAARAPTLQNNLYVVHSPPPHKSSQEWAEAARNNVIEMPR